MERNWSTFQIFCGWVCAVVEVFDVLFEVQEKLKAGALRDPQCNSGSALAMASDFLDFFGRHERTWDHTFSVPDDDDS